MKKLLHILPLLLLSFYANANQVFYAKVTSFVNSAEEPLARQCANIGVGSYIGYSSGNKTIPLRKILPNGINCISIQIGPSASVIYTRNSVQHRIWFNWEFQDTCPENQEYNPTTRLCESQCEFGENPDGSCMDACQFKQSVNEQKLLHWSAYVYGPEVTGACYGDFGATRCELRRPPVSVTVCTDADSGEFTQNTTCTSQFVFTGKQCDGGTLFWGKNGPDEPFDPDNPDDPEHKPDDPTGDIEDPSVLPDDSTNTVTPPDVNDKPDVEDPDTDDSTDTAVLSAIKGLNADVNSGIHDLNIDVNESHAKINNAVIDLKASVVGNTQAIQKQQINDNKIYNNTKALIQQANGDITTAVNKNTNATVKGLKELDASVGDLNGNLDDIKGLLKGGNFGSPNGEDVAEVIFSSDDFVSINETIQDKRQSIQDYVDQVKGLVSISTNFNNGSLTDKSFTVKGTTVESGLQRFDSVSGYVRPVVLFICALIALWILFGPRSK
ncbi:hypothetical protein ACP6H9_15370 [Vibrio harveyi]|uniref:hypothetical protein n=1 Tax=Vibrio harveyi TaxID=669 RepID=UPI00215C70BE|nr:hypothetical protein [Vibrio harveyi]MCR9769958.1 hypothetical protein [Vibrio harveyi]